MHKQYFGNYLIAKGIINPEQLMDVLGYQHSVRLKLDALALNAGFMTPEQIYIVHTWQMKIDKMFGEIAVEKGFLTAGQRDELLAIQQKNNLLLGEALVQRKYLSSSQLHQILDEYKREARYSDEQFSAIQLRDSAKVIKNILDFGNEPLREMYTDYVALLLRNLTRFIDDHPKLVSNALLVKVSSPYFVSQELKGTESIFTGIYADEEVLLQIASKMEGEQLRELDDFAKNAIQEFLSLHNGIFLANMLGKDINLESQPSQIYDDIDRVFGQGWVISLLLASGEMQLVLSDSLFT
jgi:hypothetical protein